MNLPLEVWEDIVDQCSRSDMVKLARVSSTFRKMATQILYQLLWLHINERKTIRCLKTLCSNALAAQSVKALYLGYGFQTSSPGVPFARNTGFFRTA
ncbi:hypothetical protein WG66_006688 [Moniliophthora roreri]|nr:hypothetical protein WG66_006688 [Moniliophthora roreri]